MIKVTINNLNIKRPITITEEEKAECKKMIERYKESFRREKEEKTCQNNL